MRKRRRLVIGVGNPERGDDGAGRLVARRLRGRKPRALEVRECSGEVAALLETWAGFDHVVLVDACRGAGEPGSIHRFAVGEIERLAAVEPHRHGSTHGLGVAEAVALARVLDRLPPDFVVYAIEASDCRIGRELSPPVEQAVHKLAAVLAEGLGHGLTPER